MSIKVFTDSTTIGGYVNNPADQFQINVSFTVYQSDGGEENGPRQFSSNIVIPVAIGGTPIDVYSAVYAQILSDCAANGYDTPTMDDIFAYVPTVLTNLLPHIPHMA